MRVTDLAHRFVPLQGMSTDKLVSLARTAKAIRLYKDNVLFEAGDVSPFTYFLVQGELSLSTKGGSVSKIRDSDEQASYPVGNLLPRKVTATISSDSAKLLRLDRNRLETFLSVSSGGGNSGVSIEDFSDIPKQFLDLLDTPLFERLPRENVNKLLGILKERPYKKGQAIVREGEPGEHYYFILKGTCLVTRRVDGRDVVINRLTGPDSFGEWALISGHMRDATVSMESDGVLSRLRRREFNRYVLEPMLRHTPLNRAMQKVESERARLIDVRLEAEYEEKHLPMAENTPLYLLYLKSRVMSHNRQYFVYGKNDRESKAAAFLMARQGLKVSMINGAAEMLSEEVSGFSSIR